ncbi:PulJ/GspJ family protein [Rubrimonas cliftonensis]|uniref:Prepilin-type N-terminal cleavage/methylation domain-containing protein n=1 Tax=Rubrimonas cliftonensis TaxID=89524 RepID=A0A1H3WPZ9_9RHOB|nr:prepilin-type N-terminal cleavage/methylation domain-containing protein [Rubrimonas cliftonensis]SDZ89213.1 prepilin-type N-terminal cleavage/methylation domain-containing protein [Rubrimonas cliftonensis]
MSSGSAAGERPGEGRPGEGRTAGFTLLECLVAFTALALILSASYAAFGAGARGADAAATRLEALARVESALARAAVSPPAGGAAETRDGRWTVRMTAAPYAEAPGLVRIAAEARWRDGAAERRLSLATLAPARDDRP